MRGRANEAQSSGTQRARWRGQASAATRRAAERGGEARRTLRSRKAAKPQRARLSPPRRRPPDRRHRSVTPSPAPRHGDRRRHPRPLCGSAALRDLFGCVGDRLFERAVVVAALFFSRRAAEPQSAHVKRDRRGHPDRRRWSRTPSRQGQRPMLANITLRRRGGVSGAAGKVAASLDTGRRARRYFSGTQETSDVHRIHPHPAPWAGGA